MSTTPSPAIRIYRRVSARFDPLRESLVAADFHQVVPPDAGAQWEYVDDFTTRVRYDNRVLLVEAINDANADAFDRAHRIALPSDSNLLDGGEAPQVVTLIAGSDESGKGEPTHALAVVAVLVSVHAESACIARGIRDSKGCTAAEITKNAQWIVANLLHEISVIAPQDRANALRAHGDNDSRLLAFMHSECLRRLHARNAFALARVDRFAPNRPVANALAKSLPLTIIDECVRGERHVAVAAASIVARACALGISLR